MQQPAGLESEAGLSSEEGKWVCAAGPMASKLQIHPSPPCAVTSGLQPVLSPLSNGFLLGFVHTEATAGQGGSLPSASAAF